MYNVIYYIKVMYNVIYYIKVMYNVIYYIKVMYNVIYYIKVMYNVIYRILRTIGRYFFSSTRWLRPIVHIDLYKDEVKKIWNP